MYELPAKLEQFLQGDHPIDEIARHHYDKPFFLYLGRNIGLPVALEGALKLKEISLHPDRGLLGRRDEARPDRAARRVDPVVVIATQHKRIYDKIVSNIQEVRARART